MNLCHAFPSLDPLILRKIQADEVIKLINKLSLKGRKKSSNPQTDKVRKKVYADQVNWF